MSNTEKTHHFTGVRNLADELCRRWGIHDEHLIEDARQEACLAVLSVKSLVDVRTCVINHLIDWVRKEARWLHLEHLEGKDGGAA